MKTIYCISGLGADHRVFEPLRLRDHYAIEILKWIPHKSNESLKEYAKRLSLDINTNLPHIILGVSFGGVIAMEVARITKPEKLITISSIRKPSDLPLLYRFLGVFLPIVPKAVLNVPFFFMKYAFGVKANSWQLLKRIIIEQDATFVKWSIKALLGWDGIDLDAKDQPYRIHGSNDRVLKSKSPDILIRNGGHFMIYDNADELSMELNKII